MKLPGEFLQSLEGLPGFDREAFIHMHEHTEAPTSFRINPAKIPLANSKWLLEDASSKEPLSPLHMQHSPVPWSEYGFYLERRPSFTFDPFFHAGLYYVQEASSMFLEQAFRQLLDLSQPLKVLDLCAAPGGKSTHIQSLLSKQSLLISNEIIRARSYALSDNIIKWGCQNVFVSNNDPKSFQKLTGYFDVMVVDAPCSGSGLFRKDKEAIEEWSLHNVQLCSQRQKRILADALPALKEGGLLIYSTCSYSTEEDEQIIDWLVDEMGMENERLAIENEKWRIDNVEGIVITNSSKTFSEGYRFYPDKIKGEGFFLACFRKKKEQHTMKLRPAKGEPVSNKEKDIINEWTEGERTSLLRYRDSIISVPSHLEPDFLLLQPHLNIIYAGVTIGNVLKEKLVPHHALAQNSLLSKNIPAVELSYEDAIKYLQRQDTMIDTDTQGWHVVRYKKFNLGWINALKNRVNNYYPKEIRILKAQNNSSFEK